jgi:hypothetical protein
MTASDTATDDEDISGDFIFLPIIDGIRPGWTALSR